LLRTVHRHMQDSPMIASFGLEPPSAGGGWLVDESLFRLLLELEIQKAQRLHYSVSLDAVAPWTEGWLALLLPAAEPTHLPSFRERLTARVEPIARSAGCSCSPRTAARANDMLRQAVDLRARAKAEGGNQLYVQS
jgi:hypothetical protein